jgi:hypothetical protein
VGWEPRIAARSTVRRQTSGEGCRVWTAGLGMIAVVSNGSRASTSSRAAVCVRHAIRRQLARWSSLRTLSAVDDALRAPLAFQPWR